jgi:hypothetical protein
VFLNRTKLAQRKSLLPSVAHWASYGVKTIKPNSAQLNLPFAVQLLNSKNFIENEFGYNTVFGGQAMQRNYQ